MDLHIVVDGHGLGPLHETVVALGGRAPTYPHACEQRQFGAAKQVLSPAHAPIHQPFVRGGTPIVLRNAPTK